MKPIEIQQNFHNELKQLLLKYKAEICLEQFETRYLPEEKIVINFEYDESLYEENGTGIIPQLIIGSFEKDTQLLLQAVYFFFTNILKIFVVLLGYTKISRIFVKEITTKTKQNGNFINRTFKRTI